MLFGTFLGFWVSRNVITLAESYSYSSPLAQLPAPAPMASAYSPRRFDPKDVGHPAMVIKTPAKNRALIRGELVKGKRPEAGALQATAGYTALVNRLAKSVMLAPKLVVPTGDGDHIGFPHLHATVQRKSIAGENRRLQKKLEKQRRRLAKLRDEQPPMADGLFVQREDNTYLDRNTTITRSAQRTNQATSRLVQRADATGNTFTASKRRALQPGRPRTMPDPTPSHIETFLRQRSQAAERKGAEQTAAAAPHSAHQLVRAISIQERDLYTPAHEPARAPVLGVWGPGKNDYVRVALDELEVEGGPRTVRACVHTRIHYLSIRAAGSLREYPSRCSDFRWFLVCNLFVWVQLMGLATDHSLQRHHPAHHQVREDRAGAATCASRPNCAVAASRQAGR